MSMTSENTALSAIRSAGVVGLGGAGFPSHVKYAVNAENLIVNGCECEPLLKTDVMSMSLAPEKLFGGIEVVRNIIGARRTVLAVKKKHAALHTTLAPLASLHGVELLPVDDFYPAGDEQVLIYECLGKSVPPVSLPSSVGAVVSNSATLMAVDDAVMGIPLVEKLVTVTGAVRKASVYKVPIGVPVTALIEAAGGALHSDIAVVLGGPMMGTILDEPAAIASAVVTKTLGGIIVLPAGHYLHKMSRLSPDQMRKRAATTCIQCRLCSELCPRYLIGHPFETHRIMRAFAQHNEFDPQIANLAFMCCECGICEHISCPMGLSPCSINKHIRRTLRAQKKNYQGGQDLQPDNYLWRTYRKVPISRLVERIAIGEYLAATPAFEGSLTVYDVYIPLKQHIGSPSIPRVVAGDLVKKHDLIAEIPDGALGANIHASIDGQVTSVDEAIHIKRVS